MLKTTVPGLFARNYYDAFCYGDQLMDFTKMATKLSGIT